MVYELFKKKYALETVNLLMKNNFKKQERRDVN
jgi:hypothetical protein